MIPILFYLVSAFIHNCSVGYAFTPSVHRPTIVTKPTQQTSTRFQSTRLAVTAGTVVNNEAAKVKKSREVCNCL